MSEQPEPKLIAYRIYKYPSLPIVPASSQRSWMDQTSERFAYRCLPLLIANQSGWFILNVHRIRAIWNGRNDKDAIRVKVAGGPPDTPCPAESHFGHGVLTFNLNYLFRTPPGYNLWARGPANQPKDGVTALEGIIETDWSVATFTMNWKITRPNVPIDFVPGEPICMITPVKRHEVESFRPAVTDLDTDPQLSQRYHTWAKSREQFNSQLDDPESWAARMQWQKEYLQGFSPDGTKAPEHQTKVVLREFELPKAPTT